jgi:phytanoyl-CoA hydroxylase
MTSLFFLFQDKDTYFLESADKISYFYEKDALGPNGELKVDPQLSLNKIGHALHELNPVFRKITLDERVKECCFQLGYEDPVVVQSMYIFKNPELGSEGIYLLLRRCNTCIGCTFF